MIDDIADMKAIVIGIVAYEGTPELIFNDTLSFSLGFLGYFSMPIFVALDRDSMIGEIEVDVIDAHSKLTDGWDVAKRSCDQSNCLLFFCHG